MDYLIALAVTLTYFMGGSFTYGLLAGDPSDEFGAAIGAILWPIFWITLAAAFLIFAPILLGVWAGSKVKELLK